MTKDSYAIKASDLNVSFSKWGQTVNALERINLTVNHGEWLMVVGHNGSGKSTLLRTISGETSGYTGSIKTLGKTPNQIKSRKTLSHVFMVNQDPIRGTAPQLTLFENLMIADNRAPSKKKSKNQLLTEYKRLLEPLYLSDRTKQLVENFSGGERQIIAMLIAKIRSPQLLLLDEPLAALDPAKTKLCLDLITQMHNEGTTIVEITHKAERAIHSGDRTIVLGNGELIYDQSGDSRDLEAINKAWLN